MKRFLVLFFLFSFLLYAKGSRRTEGEEYWKRVMKKEPLPEPIEELMNNPFRTKQDKFIHHFNAKSVAIIYHKPDD